jgi:uncharacterized membrane protein
MTRDDTSAVIVAVILVAVVAVLVLLPALSMAFFHGTVMGGMMGSDAEVGGLSVGTVLIILGIIIIAVILLATLLRGGRREVVYVPQPVPAPSPVVGSELPPPTAEPPTTDQKEPVPAGELERWAMRLLEGDERRLFREIVERGGTAYQKDLGVRSDFSRAKVTRILKKLENKGLVARERAGMTNRVRIVLREGGD